MTRASAAMPMLSVADLAATLRLYEGALGGERRFRFPEDGEPAFLTLGFGATEIGFGTMAGPPLHGRLLRPASGHRIELCLTVDDADRAFGEAVAAGALSVMPPADQPWGERAAYVEDPDGNLVMLVAPSA